MQNAADTFGIPKTVLWRRIQKEGHVYRTENRRTYDADKREAAIKALERGEALTKVAQEYQVKLRKSIIFNGLKNYVTVVELISLLSSDSKDDII